MLLTAAVLMLFTGAWQGAGAASGVFAFMTTTDYETGSASVIWLDGSYTTDTDVASVHSDAVARYYSGLVYVVNRLEGDNIQVLDPSNGFSTVRQFSVGNGSNPQDIAFASETKAYVTRYETNDLWIVNPSTGGYLGSIDLSQFADSDGLCEMSRVIIKGDRLFISIQRLDRDNWWLPVGDSYLAVVDVTADTLLDVDPGTPGIQAIRLSGTNPFSDIQVNPFTGMLYLSCVGMWGVADAGVEIIDPIALETAGMMITEEAAGGEINDVEVYWSLRGYAILTNASFTTDLICFNPATGVLDSVIYSPGDYVLNDIELSPDGELFCSDQTETNPGIRIYDPIDNSEITSGPISTGLPPFDIIFGSAIQTGTETPLAAALDQNYPNPFNPVTTIAFTLAEPASTRLTIHDVAGRLVATIIDGPMPAGRYEKIWNGRDDAGRAVSSGVYFIGLTSGNFRSSRKALLLR